MQKKIPYQKDSGQRKGRPVPVRANPAKPGIPNSAMLSMLDEDRSSGSSIDELGARIFQRLPSVQQRPQAQIPQAEDEADRLSSAVNAGTPASVREVMGQRLGADFSGVRFHTGAAAAARADAMGARAYTSGADIYFGSGGFDAAVAAHELVHTAQQGMVASGAQVMSTPAGGIQMLKKKEKKNAGQDLAWQKGDSGGSLLAITPPPSVPHSEYLKQSLGEDFSRMADNARIVAGHVGAKPIDYAAGKIQSAVDRHLRQVDAWNNNQESFHDMSALDQFKEYAKHPGALMARFYSKEGTMQRNEERDRIRRAAGIYRQNNEKSWDLGDASFGGLVQSAMQNPEHFSEYVQLFRDYGLGLPSSLGSGLSGGSSALKTASEMFSGSGGSGSPFDFSDGAFTMLSNGASVVNDAMGIYQAHRTGSKQDAFLNSASLTYHLATFGTGLSKVLQAADVTGAGEAIPLLNVAKGAVQAGKGISNMVSADSRSRNMNKAVAELDQKEQATGLNSNEKLIRRAASQAGDMTRPQTLEGAMDAISGAFKTLGGATGTPLGFVGTGVDMVKGLALNHVKKDLRHKVVDEQLGLDAKIKNMMETEGRSEKESKHIILMAMGFGTGKRKEAFHRIAMNRAVRLQHLANNGDEQAIKVMQGLGLRPSGGKYSLQGIAERLGMDTGTSWQDQVQETMHSRDDNPYAGRAAEHQQAKREKQEKKEAKAAAKEAAKQAKHPQPSLPGAGMGSLVDMPDMDKIPVNRPGMGSLVSLKEETPTATWKIGQKDPGAVPPARRGVIGTRKAPQSAAPTAGKSSLVSFEGPASPSSWAAGRADTGAVPPARRGVIGTRAAPRPTAPAAGQGSLVDLSPPKPAQPPKSRNPFRKLLKK